MRGSATAIRAPAMLRNLPFRSLLLRRHATSGARCHVTVLVTTQHSFCCSLYSAT